MVYSHFVQITDGTHANIEHAQTPHNAMLSTDSLPPPRDGLPRCLSRGRTWGISIGEREALVGSVAHFVANL